MTISHIYRERLLKEPKHPFFADQKAKHESLTSEERVSLIKRHVFETAKWGVFKGGLIPQDSMIVEREGGKRNVVTSKKACNPIRIYYKSVESGLLLRESTERILDGTLPIPDESDTKAFDAYILLSQIRSIVGYCCNSSDDLPAGLHDVGVRAITERLSRKNRNRLRKKLNPIAMLIVAEATFRIRDTEDASIPNRHNHGCIFSAEEFTHEDELRLSEELFKIFREAIIEAFHELNLKNEDGSARLFEERWLVPPMLEFCEHAEEGVDRPIKKGPRKVVGSINCRVVESKFVSEYLFKQGREDVGAYAAKVISNEMTNSRNKNARKAQNLTLSQLMEVLSVARNLGLVRIDGVYNRTKVFSRDGGMSWQRSADGGFVKVGKVKTLTYSSVCEPIGRLLRQWVRWMEATRNKNTYNLSRLCGKAFTHWCVPLKPIEEKGRITAITMLNGNSDLAEIATGMASSKSVHEENEQAYLELRQTLRQRATTHRSAIGRCLGTIEKEIARNVVNLPKILALKKKICAEQMLADEKDLEFGLFLRFFSRFHSERLTGKDRRMLKTSYSNLRMVITETGLVEITPRTSEASRLMDLKAICEAIAPGLFSKANRPSNKDLAKCVGITDEEIERF